VHPCSRRRFLRGGLAVLAASLPAAAFAGRGLFEVALADDTHLVEAEELIDYLNQPGCPPANNTYKAPGDPTVVTWGTPGQPATWVNHSNCGSFVTAVLRHTYPGWADDTLFTKVFGSKSPNARQYRTGLAAASAHFQPVGQVAGLLPGDLIAIDYQNGQTTDTGHVAIVRSVKGTYVAPQSDLNFAGETQYAVEVADCTGAPHGKFGGVNYAAYPDTRIVDGVHDRTGAGYGHMMFYASDATGAFARYRWSVNSSAANTFTVADRPIAAARVA